MLELQSILVNAEIGDCIAAAECMYRQDPYPRQHMLYSQYEALIMQDCKDAPTWIVIDEYGKAYAWLVFDFGYDPHFPGKGATVYYLLVDQNKPEALRILMRAFLRHARGNKCQWYQTTKRLDERTFQSEYKRLT